ncbi:MAG: glycosyltransferase [Actinomycetota bacterium]|nr:glycosyltransferase [Actinomycetota bacterium]
MVADLAAGLTARGHAVHVFAAEGSFIEGATVVETGIASAPLAPALFRAGRPSRSLPVVAEAFRHVYGLIGGRRYDVVHNHAFDVPAVSLSRDLGCSVVHTLHLPPDEAVAGALREAASASPMIVAAVSNSLRGAWSNFVRVDALLRNGVPVRRIPWSAQAGRPALFAGRFSPEKGALEALEIAERAGLPITLIGNAYDPGYARMVEKRCRSVKGARIEPTVPREVLWKRMSESAVVLCPARWEEPFGMVAAESLAAGTPVVGFARGGLVEVVGTEQTGELVPDGDIPAAVAAVGRSASIEREACRRHAEATLDLEQTLDAHESLYRSLV